MKFARELSLFGLALIVGCECTLAWKQRQEILSRRAETHERVSLDSQLALARDRELALRRGLAQDRRRAAGDDQAAEVVSVTNTAQGFNFNVRFKALLENPEFRANLAVMQRANIGRFYGSLFKTLNLPPDQLEKLKGLVVEQQLAKTDALNAAGDEAQGHALTMGETNEAISAAQKGVSDQIHALLGDANFEQFQEFQQSRFLHLAVDQLQQSLSYTSTPLGDDQASQLVRALFQAIPPEQRPAPDGFMAQVGAGLFDSTSTYLAKLIPDQSLVAAQGVVSAPQLDALRQIQQAQISAEKIAKLYRTAHPPNNP